MEQPRVKKSKIQSTTNKERDSKYQPIKVFASIKAIKAKILTVFFIHQVDTN